MVCLAGESGVGASAEVLAAGTVFRRFDGVVVDSSSATASAVAALVPLFLVGGTYSTLLGCLHPRLLEESFELGVR